MSRSREVARAAMLAGAQRGDGWNTIGTAAAGLCAHTTPEEADALGTLLALEDFDAIVDLMVVVFVRDFRGHGVWRFGAPSLQWLERCASYELTTYGDSYLYATPDGRKLKSSARLVFIAVAGSRGVARRTRRPRKADQ